MLLVYIQYLCIQPICTCVQIILHIMLVNISRVIYVFLLQLAQKVYNMKCHLMEHGIEEGNNILRCNCSIKEAEDEVVTVT